MSVHLDPSWLLATAAVSVRLGAIFVLTPLFGGFAIPVQVRVFAVLAFAGVMVSGGLIPVLPLPGSAGELVLLLAREALIGALMAFALSIAFSAFLFAGRVLDMQIGFGIATLIDPVTRSQSPLIGTVLQLMAAAVFFAVDGHHMLMRAAALSLQHAPPAASFTTIDGQVIVAQFGMLFVWGLMLVAPALFALLLIDVGLAVMSRSMPQMNVFIVAIPLKVMVGLAMLATTVATLGDMFQRILNSTFEFWLQGVS